MCGEQIDWLVLGQMLGAKWNISCFKKELSNRKQIPVLVWKEETRCGKSSQTVLVDDANISGTINNLIGWAKSQWAEQNKTNVLPSNIETW